jgi:acyl-CoA thioesterase FadM
MKTPVLRPNCVTWSGRVTEAECDRLGHMNIQHHARIASDATFAFFDLSGWPKVAEETQTEIVGAKLEISFKNEAWPSTEYIVYTGVTDILSEEFSLHHYIWDKIADHIISSIKIRAVCINNINRKRITIPAIYINNITRYSIQL